MLSHLRTLVFNIRRRTRANALSNGATHEPLDASIEAAGLTPTSADLFNSFARRRTGGASFLQAWRIDWIELIGIATLLIAIGTFCAVFFAI